MKTMDIDIVFDALWRKVKEYRYEIYSSLFFGLLAYGYYFTNMLYNHDSMNEIVLSYNCYYTSGRWGIDLLAYVFPHPTMPWYDGLVSLFLYTLGICMVSNLFQLRNKYTRILLAAVVISFPSISVEYLFIYQAIYYSLAFILAILSVYLWANAKSLWWYAMAVLSIVMSLGLYQGLLAIASSLMVVYLVREVFLESESIDRIVKKGLVGLVVLGAGVVFYFMVTQFVFLVTDSGFNDYAKAAMENDSPLYARLLKPYTRMFEDLLFLNRWRPYVVVSRVSSCFHVLALLCCGYMLFREMRGRTLSEKALLIALLVLFPLSINFMWAVSNLERATKPLVQVGFLSWFVLLAVVLENASKRKLATDMMKLSLCFIIFANVRFANVTAMRTKILFDHSFSFYTTLVTQIKSSGLLDDQSKLAICGKTDQFLYDMKRKYPDWMYYPGEGVNNYSRQNFIRFLLGFDIPSVLQAEKQEIVSTKEFQAMPIYPYEGSIRKFGDVIVVKFSDE